MEHELLNYCSILPSTGGLGTLDNISFGTVCIARWDRKWCRAVVVCRSEEESNLVDTVDIRLLDLGKDRDHRRG